MGMREQHLHGSLDYRRAFSQTEKPAPGAADTQDTQDGHPTSLKGEGSEMVVAPIGAAKPALDGPFVLRAQRTQRRG